MAMIKKINVGGVEYSLGGSGGGGGAYIVPNDADNLSYYGGIEEIVANYLVAFQIHSAQGSYVSPFYDFVEDPTPTFTFIQMDVGHGAFCFSGVFLGYGETFLIGESYQADITGNLMSMWEWGEDDSYPHGYSIDNVRLLPKATLS